MKLEIEKPNLREMRRVGGALRERHGGGGPHDDPVLIHHMLAHDHDGDDARGP